MADNLITTDKFNNDSTAQKTFHIIQYNQIDLRIRHGENLHKQRCYICIKIYDYYKYRYAVAEWYGAGLVGSNPANGCCVSTPTQRAILQGLVNEYQRKAGE